MELCDSDCRDSIEVFLLLPSCTQERERGSGAGIKARKHHPVIALSGLGGSPGRKKPKGKGPSTGRVAGTEIGRCSTGLSPKSVYARQVFVSVSWFCDTCGASGQVDAEVPNLDELTVEDVGWATFTAIENISHPHPVRPKVPTPC
jgi:hypothetical protein